MPEERAPKRMPLIPPDEDDAPATIDRSPSKESAPEVRGKSSRGSIHRESDDVPEKGQTDETKSETVEKKTDAEKSEEGPTDQGLTDQKPTERRSSNGKPSDRKPSDEEESPSSRRLSSKTSAVPSERRASTDSPPGKHGHKRGSAAESFHLESKSKASDAKSDRRTSKDSFMIGHHAKPKEKPAAEHEGGSTDSLKHRKESTLTSDRRTSKDSFVIGRKHKEAPVEAQGSNESIKHSRHSKESCLTSDRRTSMDSFLLRGKHEKAPEDADEAEDNEEDEKPAAAEHESYLYREFGLSDADAVSMAYTIDKSTTSILSLLKKKKGIHDDEDEVEAPVEEKTLSKLKAHAFAAILGYCIDQIVIASQVLPHRRISMQVRYSSMEEKYSVERTTRLYDPHTLQSYVEAEAELETVKFQKDRAFIQALLNETVSELKEEGTYDGLKQHLNDYRTELEEEQELLVTVEVKKEKLGDLKLMNDENKRSIMSSNLLVLKEMVGNLKDEYERRLVITGVEMSYLNKWENARCESNKYGHDFTENEYKEMISHYEIQMEREERIDEEITKYLEEQQIDAEENLEQWMETYEREVESKDMDIMLMKEKIEGQQQRIELLKALYADHKTQIKEYSVVREERRRKELEEEMREEAACKIQRWWRRVMYQKHLGPYRKKKGKGKKDKGKNKKKKK